MCPLRRHHRLTQKNTNPGAYNEGEPRVTTPFLYFIFGIYTIKILPQCTTRYLQKNARWQRNTCKRLKFIYIDQFQHVLHYDKKKKRLGAKFSSSHND